MEDVIIVSAVNLVSGGPLTILKKCLEALDSHIIAHNIKVVALVHQVDLCYYPNIEYIEMPWTKKSWVHRVFFEYVYARKISKRTKPTLWLSLHDVTPNVEAKIRAVYCHNPTPFYHPAIEDIK